MKIVQASQLFSFNYTSYDQNASLYVAFKIYDVSTGTAVFIQTVNAALSDFGAYVGVYTGSSNRTYLIIGVVYTSNNYTIVDTTRAPSSEIYQCSQATVNYFGFSYGAYDQASTLHMQGSVYNLSSGTPVFLQTLSMAHVAFGVYFGSYSASPGLSFQIISEVYTDSGHTIPDLDRAPGCDGFDSIVNGLFITGAATLIGQTL